MATSIRLELETEGPEERIRAESFLEAMAAARDILHEIDKVIGQGRLRWYFTELQVGSGIAVLHGEWHESDDEVPLDSDVEELRNRIASAWVTGLTMLDMRPEWPEHFTQDALEACRRLVAVKHEDIVAIVASATNAGRTSVTERVIANVNDLVRPQHTALGAVQGVIETISLARSQRLFRIRDDVTGRSVPAHFTQTQFPGVRDALGLRAIVRGMLGYSRFGQLTTISAVDDVIVLDGPRPRTIDHLVGVAPNLTDGLPAEMYLTELHDERYATSLLGNQLLHRITAERA